MSVVERAALPRVGRFRGRRGRRRHRRERGEEGTMMLWVLGLCVSVLFLGGLSVDLWRVIAVRRDLATMADGAAAAGADGIDEESLRTGEVSLDPDLARRLSREHLGEQSDAGIIDDVEVGVTASKVVVTVRSEVPFTLLGVFLDGGAFAVTVTADAEPRRRT